MLSGLRDRLHRVFRDMQELNRLLHESDSPWARRAIRVLRLVVRLRAFRAITALGWWVLALAVAAWLGGWWLGWHELMLVAAGSLVTVLLSVLFTLGRARWK